MALVFVAFAAILRGSGPEKASAAALVWMSVIGIVESVLFSKSSGFFSVTFSFAFVDLSTLFILLFIAIKANRVYTLWLAGFQIIATTAHLAKALAGDISPIAYAIMTIAPSYFQIIILAFGIWLHHRRVKRHGNYRSWRNSLPLSRENAQPN